MLTIKNYVRAETVQQAYDLAQKRNNVVLGGMLWLKMQSKAVDTAIDLCGLGLDKITEDENNFYIGAMVSLRSLETHKGLNQFTNNALAESVKHIVGVQFRNCATVGGSIWGRFGFSDVLTLFSVLNAKIVLYKNGEKTVEEFLNIPRNERDILTQIIVPKNKIKVSYISQRNSATDFPTLACAVSIQDNKCLCAVGARPGYAVTFGDEKGILKDGITPESAQKYGEYVADRAVFGSNMRAGAQYRKKICKVLVKRALLKAEEIQYAD